MNIFSKPSLLLPVLVVGLLFIADKIFLLPEVRDNFLQPGGMVYYRQRDLQIQRLKDHLADHKTENEKTIVVLGDSRSFALGNAPAHYSGYANVNIFNFASPQAVPAYHDYMTYRILSSIHKPDYIILGLSLDGFNRSSGMMASPTMNFGLDAQYIQHNKDHIAEKDMQTYERSRRWALAGMRFSFSTLMSRLWNTVFPPKDEGNIEAMVFLKMFLDKTSDPAMSRLGDAMISTQVNDISLYSVHTSPEKYILDLGQGAQYSWFGTMNDRELREETERLKRLYLASYEESAEQLWFFENMLKRAKEAGVPVLVYLPQVNPYLAKLYETEPRIIELAERIRSITVSQGALFEDLNEPTPAHCTHYYDASHMSIMCFPGIADYLLGRLPGL